MDPWAASEHRGSISCIKRIGKNPSSLEEEDFLVPVCYSVVYYFLAERGEIAILVEIQQQGWQESVSYKIGESQGIRLAALLTEAPLK